MRRMSSVGSLVGVLGVVVASLPGRVEAQGLAKSKVRPFIDINAGMTQPSTERVSEVAFVTDGTNRDEARADYTIANSPTLDVGGGVVFGPGIMVGMALSYGAASEPADLTLTLTHPRFHPTLVATTSTSPLRREETGVHIQFGYVIPSTGRLEVRLFGGPSYFHLSQPLIVDFSGDEIFNPATRTFSAVVSDPMVETKTGGTWGYNVGTDVSFAVARHVSIGGLVRYGAGTVTMDAPLQSVVRDRDATQDFEVGGLQLLGGIRFRF